MQESVSNYNLILLHDAFVIKIFTLDYHVVQHTLDNFIARLEINYFQIPVLNSD